jgi:predicted signal transduction protein with EAL and GGDEF domain
LIRVANRDAILSHAELVAVLAEKLQRTQGSQALLLINLDDLLRLQVQLGFQATAALVNTLCENFSLALGDRGAVLRFGDASFCVLIGAIRNGGHAVLAAEKLSRAADTVMSAAAMTIKPGLSIGIALYPRDTCDPADLLRKAQLASVAALNRAARVVSYDDHCAGQVLKPRQLGEAFAEALETGALSVHYQPKVRIADGRAAGVEALLRWMRDDIPVSTPDVFVPLAEEAGLIHDTTWYVLSNALRQSTACSGLPVAVNISPHMLHHREFIEMVRSAVRTWNVREGVLTLELTEGALIADFDQATALLRQVRELGVRISIDDFGTGYSSLSYFKKIPADELKIDKSFVTRMLEDQADQRLVEVIVNLARQFALEVVAEGVEDRETLTVLASMGCHYAQGHLIAPALDGERLCAWLREN